MESKQYTEQLDVEWLVINALRETVKIATRGDMRATYEQVIKLGQKLYPDLYNSEESILVKENESDLIKEYQQFPLACK